MLQYFIRRNCLSRIKRKTLNYQFSEVDIVRLEVKYKRGDLLLFRLHTAERQRAWELRDLRLAPR